MFCRITSNAVVDEDLFGRSLWGEYTRLIIAGTAACSALVWIIRFPIEPSGAAMVCANLLVLGVTWGNRLAGLWRLVVLSLFMVGLIVAFAVKQEPDIWWSPLVIFSPMVTIGALLVLITQDGLVAMKRRAKAISLWQILFVIVLLSASIYMIMIPAIDALLEPWRERPSSFKVEQLSAFEILRVRTAKLAVFSYFAYLGACAGSFLNVVAKSAPHGRAIALRSSTCPMCGSLIRRIDNLPIFGYVRLRGQCRNCKAAIPIRYFFVELTGFTIFASLFLYELVTGAANVPGFLHYHHAGILWIILYTKWPVVGIYFYHCLLFSCILMLALMEQDHLRAPRWMGVVLPLIFAITAIVSPTMLTVSLGDQTPFQLPMAFPDWLDRAMTSATGGIAGWMIGHFAKPLRLRRRQSSSSLGFAFVLIGVSIGWQAVLSVALFWLAAMSILKSAGGPRMRPRWLTATTLLFAMLMLFHPAWKWFATHVSF